VVCGGLWAAGAGWGLWVLAAYANSPGESGAVPAAWPAGSRLERAADRATLVMLAHPHCPCTRASIAELERALAAGGETVATHVVFIQPAAAGPEWRQSDLLRRAAAIPGVRVHWDAGEAEARRFGIQTSGHTLLYDAGGRLLFSGGITGARGHEGDNTGRSAIVSLLLQGKAARARSLVFGCSLGAAGAGKR